MGTPAGRSGHIVVVGQWRHGMGCLPTPYVEAVRAAGGNPHIFSAFDLPDEKIPAGVPCDENLDEYDASPIDGAVGLLLPGGGDLDPVLYHRPTHPRTQGINHRRDRFEHTLLEEALTRDLPVLAVCHGMQLLNVFLGGTLDQHLSDRIGSLEHDHGDPTPTPAHEIKIAPGSRLAAASGVTEMAINSHHHQGLDDVAGSLRETAWAPDGVLEAVESSEHTWVLGCQWHPEVMAPADGRQAAIFSAFVAVAAASDRGSREIA